MQGYKPNNTTHAGPYGTTSGNNSRRGQGDDQGPLHAYASVDTPWVAQALSHYTSVRYGWIASISVAHDATQFGDSICPISISTFKCLFNRAQPTWALIDTGGGYRLGAPNIRSDHSPSFPSSILHFPLITPPGLQLCQSFDHLAKPHRTSTDRKGLIVSGFQPLIFYR
jgi:hypothetical protein